MVDFFAGVLAHVEAFQWIIFLLCLWALYRGIARAPIEWWEFIATRGTDGKAHADVDKLGKMVAIFVSSWFMLKISNHVKPSGGEFALIMTGWLAFVGAVAGWAAYLRSKSERIETRTVEEPASPTVAMKTSTTVSEPVIPQPQPRG